MATISKKDLVNQIANNTQTKRIMVKHIIQAFLDEIVKELSKGNRLEFRDFGVFETRTRAHESHRIPKHSNLWRYRQNERSNSRWGVC
jgi:integration host factor subunit beta